MKTKFKKDCVVIIRNVIEKLQDRSPLKYSIVRYSASLSPVKMIHNKEECVLKFKRLIEKLCEMKWISAVDADDSKLQYEEFLTSASSEYKNHFLDYCRNNDSIDKFLGLYIDQKKFDKFWNICKIIFTLSHGQAAVERGFSVNREIIVENLQQKSLISQRLVYDYITVKHASSLYEYAIPNALLLECKISHAKYVQFLEDQKKANVRAEKSRKRTLILDEISEFKKKKLNLEQCISSLKSDVKKYGLEAEEKQDLTLLSKANSFRKTIKDKQGVQNFQSGY